MFEKQKPKNIFLKVFFALVFVSGSVLALQHSSLLKDFGMAQYDWRQIQASFGNVFMCSQDVNTAVWNGNIVKKPGNQSADLRFKLWYRSLSTNKTYMLHSDLVSANFPTEKSGNDLVIRVPAGTTYPLVVKVSTKKNFNGSLLEHFFEFQGDGSFNNFTVAGPANNNPCQPSNLPPAPMPSASNPAPVGQQIASTTSGSLFACMVSTNVIKTSVRIDYPTPVAARILPGYKTSGQSGTIYDQHVSNVLLSNSSQRSPQISTPAPNWFSVILASQRPDVTVFDWDFNAQRTTGGLLGTVNEINVQLVPANPADNGRFPTQNLVGRFTTLPSCAQAGAAPQPTGGVGSVPRSVTYAGKRYVRQLVGETPTQACNTAIGNNGLAMVPSANAFTYGDPQGVARAFEPNATYFTTFNGGKNVSVCKANSTSQGALCNESKQRFPGQRTYSYCAACNVNNGNYTLDVNFADERIVECSDNLTLPSNPALPDSRSVGGRFFVKVLPIHGDLINACAAHGRSALKWNAGFEHIGELFENLVTQENPGQHGANVSYLCTQPNASGDPACNTNGLFKCSNCNSVPTNNGPGGHATAYYGECGAPLAGAAPAAPAAPQQVGTPQQATNGSGHVTYSFTASDPAGRDTSALLEVSLDGGATFRKATLVSVTNARLDNALSPQINNIITSVAPVTVTYVWDSKADGLNNLSTQTAQFRVTLSVASGAFTQAATANFSVDNAAPSSFGPITATNVTTNGLTMNLAPAAIDPAGIRGYNIAIGANRNDVVAFGGSATVGFAGPAAGLAIPITGLAASTTYFLDAQAVDTFGNLSNVNDISTATLASAGGTTGVGTTVGGTVAGGTTAGTTATGTTAGGTTTGTTATGTTAGGTTTGTTATGTTVGGSTTGTTATGTTVGGTTTGTTATGTTVGGTTTGTTATGTTVGGTTTGTTATGTTTGGTVGGIIIGGTTGTGTTGTTTGQTGTTTGTTGTTGTTAGTVTPGVVGTTTGQTTAGATAGTTAGQTTAGTLPGATTAGAAPTTTAGGAAAGGTTAGGAPAGTTAGATVGGAPATGGVGGGGGGGGGGFRTPQAPLNCLGSDICTTVEEGDFVQRILDGGDFSSLPADQRELFAFIAFLLRSDGFSIDDFRKDLSREFAVRVLVTLLKIHGKVSDADIARQSRSPYPDVSIDTVYGKMIALLTEMAVVEGYLDGNFRPGDVPNLAEIYRMITGAAGYLSPMIGQLLREAVVSGSFLQDWFGKYIYVLMELDLPVFQNYWQLGEPTTPLFFLTMLQKVLKAGGVIEPLSNSGQLSDAMSIGIGLN